MGLQTLHHPSERAIEEPTFGREEQQVRAAGSADGVRNSEELHTPSGCDALRSVVDQAQNDQARPR